MSELLGYLVPSKSWKPYFHSKEQKNTLKSQEACSFRRSQALLYRMRERIVWAVWVVGSLL